MNASFGIKGRFVDFGPAISSSTQPLNAQVLENELVLGVYNFSVKKATLCVIANENMEQIIDSIKLPDSKENDISIFLVYKRKSNTLKEGVLNSLEERGFEEKNITKITADSVSIDPKTGSIEQNTMIDGEFSM